MSVIAAAPAQRPSRTTSTCNTESGRTLATQTVLIAGDRVTAVISAAHAPGAGPGDHVIDLSGKTVLPGMTLGHRHIGYNDVTTARDTMFKYTRPEVTPPPPPSALCNWGTGGSSVQVRSPGSTWLSRRRSPAVASKVRASRRAAAI